MIWPTFWYPQVWKSFPTSLQVAKILSCTTSFLFLARVPQGWVIEDLKLPFFRGQMSNVGTNWDAPLQAYNEKWTLRLDPRKMIPPPGAEKHERPKSFLTPRKIQKSWEERCRGCMAKSPFQDIHVQIVWPKLWDFNDLNSPYNKYTFSLHHDVGCHLRRHHFTTAPITDRPFGQPLPT